MTDDPNDVRGMLAAAFAERPTPVVDAATREERRRRAVSGIQAILAQPRAPRRAIVHRIRWGETAIVMALAAGLAMVVGQLLPSGSGSNAPVPSFRAVASNGEILCDRGDGKSWSSCDPAKASGVVGLRTLENATISVETLVGVRIDVDASSTLLMPDASASALASRITLTDGSVDVKVPKLGPNRQFSVLTPTATITVHGTAFSVEVKRQPSSATRTCVRLREGVISVLSDEREERLVAPATWGCGEGAEAVAATSAVVVEPNDAPRDEAAGKAGTNPRRPNLANVDRSTLAVETKLLQRALGAERRKDLVTAEKSLRQLLTQYPNSVVAPEARAALERIRAQRVDQR